MNGAADLGGMHGFGPVRPEPGEPVFHADWEKRALALTLAMGATGVWTIDRSRFARESLPPAEYLSSSYYRIWIAALERLLVAHDLVTEDELAEGASEIPPAEVPRVLAAGEATAVLGKRVPYDRPAKRAPRLAVGDAVRVKVRHPAGHTRMPRYVRGRMGRVVRIHGHHVLPDASAEGRGDIADWLYLVRFEATELWGPDTTAAAIHLDLWEPYLEPA